MKKEIEIAIKSAIIGAFVSFIIVAVYYYNQYSIKEAVCNQHGGILIETAGFEDYGCVNLKAFLWVTK